MSCDFRHSPDFRCVYFNGDTYTLSPRQAAVIEALTEGAERQLPDLSAEYLLDRAGSEAHRLVDLFRHQPAWGRLLKPGERRGTYRLAVRPYPSSNREPTCSIATTSEPSRAIQPGFISPGLWINPDDGLIYEWDEATVAR